MCYDISFSTRYELITDYVPGLVIDPQVSIDFDMNLHVMEQAFKKYPVIIFEDGQYKLKPFEWGGDPGIYAYSRADQKRSVVHV